MKAAAAGAAALACGNAECRKALAPPLLQCSKCKAEAYCCKACQVGDPAAPDAHRAPRPRACACSLTCTRPPCMHPRRQTAAWKAGHKHKCGAPGQGAAAAQLRRAAQAGAARAPAGLTPEQNRLGMRLSALQDAGDWQGVMSLEREALALAQDIREVHPGNARTIYSILGHGFERTGEYARARELHEQHRAMAEALGDRVGVAKACGNLGTCYYSTGDYGRAREMHEQHGAMAEALGDRAGVARSCTTARGTMGGKVSVSFTATSRTVSRK